MARQAEIVDAATDVFRVRGFDATALDDVAAAVGLGRASLYHYVPSKAHLLYLVLDRSISLALQRVEALSSAEPAERLEGFIRQQVSAIADNPAMFTVFFDDRSALAERYEAVIVAKERRYLALLSAIVRDAAEAGVIAAVEPRYGAQAILGMTSWVYKWFDPSRHNVSTVIDTCLRLLQPGGRP